MVEQLTLQAFYDRLERHDWYYDWSDDNSVWRRGRAEATALKAISQQSPEHMALFTAYSVHKFTGKPWGNEQQPKPGRPA